MSSALAGAGGHAGSASGAGGDDGGVGSDLGGRPGGEATAGAAGQAAEMAGAGGEGGDARPSCDETSGQQSTLVNGGFELPEAHDIVSIDEGQAPEGFGWSVTTNGVEVVRVGYTHAGSTWSSPAYEGEQFLDLVGIGSTGAIAETVSVVPGQSYALTFAYSDNAGIVPQGASARVSVGDCGGTLASTSISHDTATLTDADWTLGELKFVARSKLATLEFVTTEARGNGGILLDGIELVATE